MKTKDCIAAITGGASGLGEACVRLLSGDGARVAILDLQSDRGETLASELGENVIFVKTDVTTEESTRAAVNRVVEAFGGINTVINCAGVGDPAKVLSKRGPMPLALFNRVVQINLVGTFNVIRLALEKMVKNPPNEGGERGVIINTASAAAFDEDRKSVV